MTSLADRAIAEEQMDAAELDAATYTRVVGDLAKVNRMTMAARPTLAFIARAIGARKSFSLLDVGFGDGDMLRTIARWAAKRGIEARLTGIDLNAKSCEAARAHTPPGLAIDYRAGDYRDCGPCDLVVSSLVAHHMTHPQLIAFLRYMEAGAALGWLVNDLHRHRFAHTGFPLLARLMRWHRIVREDGTLSIARSYRPAEWLPILEEAGIEAGAARVFRAFPFRLCVERLR